jgi:hypothetical protein
MNRDDDFDMPELTDQMIAEFKHTDLHLGPAQVKPVHAPKAKPADLSGLVADAVIGVMYLGAILLFVKVWIWAVFS